MNNVRNEKCAVAVIPARSGSKGIRGKNVQSLAGKPLISYTIEAALKSRFIDRVIVSTDSAEIANVAKFYGAEVPFLRPPELSKDDTPGILVLKHAVNYLKQIESYNMEVAVFLQPTSPLRGERRIDEVIEKLLVTDADSVVTVCVNKHHPYWSFIIKDDDLLYPFSKEGIEIARRQDLPEIFAVNGAVYALKSDVLFKSDSIFGKNTRAVIMPDEESVDIDNYLDLFFAEMLLKHWDDWIDKKNKDKQ